jgi:deoxycytidylate deaminase
VGAALTDSRGNVIATGTNEVPKAGGGVYGGDFAFERGEVMTDERCSVTKHYCSNTRVQAEIMKEVIDAIPQLRDAPDHAAIRRALTKTSLGRLLEYSRAVHAEMDAILSAAREGSSTVGAKLFVTTFPCHYCARHIVSSGIDEVQFIEPYPKSRAFELHGDAIEGVFTKWYKEPPEKPSKVLFRPFTGVAPRLYVRAFLKNRNLKNTAGDQEVSQPKWAPGLLQKSYLEIEKVLGDNHEL